MKSSPARTLSNFTLALLLALSLSACTQRGPALPSGGQEAQQLWASFTALAAPAPTPTRLDGSLRFGPQNNTNRVTYVIWNNGGLPLRMDVQAGAGMTAANIGVEDDTILAYLPRDHKAYIGTDAPDKALRALGLPLPLSVSRLNSFIQGRYLEALGQPQVLGSSRALNGNMQYRIKNDVGESDLELSAQARPVRWSIPRSWEVNIDYDASGLPSRIDATLPPSVARDKDFHVVLLIKNRRAVSPFSPSDLRLDLPPETPVYNLDS